MITLTFNNDKSMPALGFGTWRLDKSSAAEAVYHAIKTGYRHIDCAMIYGNEQQVGEGIKKAIADGLVTREELFITSKLWNTDHAPEHVAEACRKTVNDLGLEYLDLYLIHWATGFVHGEDLEPLDESGMVKLSFVPIHKTWQAMEKLVDEGLVVSLGVANFGTTDLVDLLGYATIKPVINQIELHPYHAQQSLVDFCEKLDIRLTAYSPLSSSGNVILNDKTLQAIAETHHKTPAQIALRWALQRGTSVIPKSSNPDRIQENFDISDFELTSDQMDKIKNLDKRLITCNPIGWWGIPYFD